MEIERKWLVKGWPEGLAEAVTYRMRQGYVSLRPTVRIREEAAPGGTRWVLCFKGKAGPGGLSRQEIETDIDPELFGRLEAFIGLPLIEKEQRRYPLPGGLMLEVNAVDPTRDTAFYYAEVEFEREEQAKAWQPGALKSYLANEVTSQPGQSMAAYWAATRGDME